MLGTASLLVSLIHLKSKKNQTNTEVKDQAVNVLSINNNSTNYTGYQLIKLSILKDNEARYKSHKSFLKKME